MTRRDQAKHDLAYALAPIYAGALDRGPDEQRIPEELRQHLFRVVDTIFDVLQREHPCEG